MTCATWRTGCSSYAYPSVPSRPPVRRYPCRGRRVLLRPGSKQRVRTSGGAHRTNPRRRRRRTSSRTNTPADGLWTGPADRHEESEPARCTCRGGRALRVRP
ncbi:hypothetical protein QJS66_22945 [Kocuria rhizophila]|nr:hypothetical protein QJS66_22945 [Kocuria rhizophila]